MSPIIYEKPTFFIRFAEVSGFVGGSLNVATIWLIVNVPTRSASRQYRYYILAYQVSSTLLELTLHLFAPEFYFPTLSCRIYGVLYTTLGISFKPAFQIVSLLLITMLVLTSHCFLYRHRQILPEGHWLRIKISTYACIIVTHQLGYSVLGLYLIQLISIDHPPTASGLGRLLRDFPEYAYLAAALDAYVVDNTIPIAAPLINLSAIDVLLVLVLCFSFEISLVVGFAEATCFIGHAFYTLRHNGTSMSLKTRKMHRKLIVALIMQMLIPLSTFALPVSSLSVQIIFGLVWPQVLINSMELLMGHHATVSSLLICCFTESYRDYVHRIFDPLFGFARQRSMFPVSATYPDAPRRGSRSCA